MLKMKERNKLARKLFNRRKTGEKKAPSQLKRILGLIEAKTKKNFIKRLISVYVTQLCLNTINTINK